MNDLFIIIVCIILLLIVWGLYFKYIKEGMDPKAANYTMPISFTGDQTAKTEKIKVPQFIESNNGQPLTLVNDTNVAGVTNLKDTNIRGQVRIPNNTAIEFGAGETKEVNAGKITYGTWHDKGLCIVGGGGAEGQGTRKVHMWDDVIVNNDLTVNNNLNIKPQKSIQFENGSYITSKNDWENDPNSLQIVGCDGNGGRRIHMWDHVAVNSNLEVKHGDLTVQNGHGINTGWLNVGNSTTMRGMQAGTNWDGRDNGYIGFNPWFSTNRVFVLITKINGEQDRNMVTYTAYNISERGFNYRQAGTYQGSNWAYVTHWPGYAFNWVAFAMG